MKVDNINYKIIDTFDNIITIPDCFVNKNNKIGKGHGESKLYISSKSNMIDFFGGNDFSAKCFIKKQDLMLYLNTLKNEYYKPSQNYFRKDLFVDLWKERMKYVESLDDIIYFNVNDQFQITGKRGYVNSNDEGILNEINVNTLKVDWYKEAYRIIFKNKSNVNLSNNESIVRGKARQRGKFVIFKKMFKRLLDIIKYKHVRDIYAGAVKHYIYTKL